jgi:transposase
VTDLPPLAAGCMACAARDQVIAEQGRMLGEQGGRLGELRAEVADMRRQLGRNSGNSSMPPSADDLPGRVPPRRERCKDGTGRKRGKQPGAPGVNGVGRTR